MKNLYPFYVIIILKLVKGDTMSNILFTSEDITKLKENPWVKNVTEKAITYKDEFKVHFINEYNLGKTPKQIFKECGFDIKMLGDKRIEQCTARFKRQNLRAEGLSDTRSVKSGRIKDKVLTLEEENELLRKKNLQLQQELEFLKKMEFLVRQAKQNKSKR